MGNMKLQDGTGTGTGNEDRIAIDIVLVPPDEVLEFAIKLNRAGSDSRSDYYLLHEKTCVPHISLLMGLARRSQIPDISAKVETLSDRISPMRMMIDGWRLLRHVDNKPFSVLSIEKTDDLQALHETVLHELRPFLDWKNATTEMFVTPPPVSEKSAEWIGGFGDNSTGAKFKPHMSIGFLEPTNQEVSMLFSASRLALFHLGSYCTCRVLLWPTGGL